MPKLDSKPPHLERLRADLQVVWGAFGEHLRKRHCAPRTVHDYQLYIARAARLFCRPRRSLSTLRREEVQSLVRRFLRGRTADTRRVPRAALHAWLKFIGRFQVPAPPSLWQGWLDDYARFLEGDRGLVAEVCRHYRRDAGRYLVWQFPRGRVSWNRVRAEDIWRYADRLRLSGLNPKTLADKFCALRQFLRFVHLRGGCSPALAQAVPTIPDRGRLDRCEVMTEGLRCKFLASFDRQSAQGRRDYTMALCMLDLGLRRIEIVRLRLSDIDWKRQRIAVPPAKASRGRELPLPRHVASALRRYVQTRPATDNDSVFVGEAALVGRPVTTGAVSAAMAQAYRRCGCKWSYGTHRLRHSFATRLHAHGANMKEIADLLGHRHVTTTDRYTRVDPQNLRALARPWPD